MDQHEDYSKSFEIGFNEGLEIALLLCTLKVKQHSVNSCTSPYIRNLLLEVANDLKTIKQDTEDQDV